MFILELYDSLGNKLSEGDTVKVSNGRGLIFYTTVVYLEEEQVINPFHTFSFHNIEKVDCVPEGCSKSTEERYDIWLAKDRDGKGFEDAERYLTSWRICEHKLAGRMYRIQRHISGQKDLF